MDVGIDCSHRTRRHGAAAESGFADVVAGAQQKHQNADADQVEHAFEDVVVAAHGPGELRDAEGELDGIEDDDDPVEGVPDGRKVDVDIEDTQGHIRSEYQDGIVRKKQEPCKENNAGNNIRHGMARAVVGDWLGFWQLARIPARMSELVTEVTFEVFQESEACGNPKEKLKDRADQPGDDVADIRALQDRPASRSKENRSCGGEQPYTDDPGQDAFDAEPVERKYFRADKGALRLIASGNQDGMPVAPKHIGLFVFRERAPERGCFVLHLGVEIGGEFAQEIALPRRGQIAAHSVKITVE